MRDDGIARSLLTEQDEEQDYDQEEDEERDRGSEEDATHDSPEYWFDHERLSRRIEYYAYSWSCSCS